MPSATGSCGAHRPITRPDVRTISLACARSVHQGQLPGIPALPGRRSRNRRRRRGIPACPDRSGATPARCAAQFSLRSAWQRLASASPHHGGRVEGRCDHRLGCEPDHPRAALCRALRPDQGRRLVAGRQWHPGHLAAAAVELRQALSLDRLLGRRRSGLQRAGLAGRGAGQPEVWPPLGGDPGRRRSDDVPRDTVDRGPSPDSRSSTSCTTTAPGTRS